MLATTMCPPPHAEPHPIDHKKGSPLFSLPSLFRGRPRSSSNASSGTRSPSTTSRDVSPAPSIGSTSSKQRGGDEGRSPSSTRQALPKIILLVDGCSPPPLSPKSRTRALPIVGPGGAHHSPAHAHSPLDPAHSHSLESSLSHSHLSQSIDSSSSDSPTPLNLSPTETPPSSRERSPPPHDAPVSSSLPNPLTTILSASPDETDSFAAPPIGSSITDPHRPKAARHATPAVVHPSCASTRTARGGRTARVGAGFEEEKREKRRSTIEMKVGGWVEVEQDY